MRAPRRYLLANLRGTDKSEIPRIGWVTARERIGVQLVATCNSKRDGVGMSNHDVPETVLHRIDETRRSFVRKLITSSAFVVPAVASFQMAGLSISEAQAQVGNQVSNTIPTNSPVGLGAAAVGLLLTGAALLSRGLNRKAEDGDDGSK